MLSLYYLKSLLYLQHISRGIEARVFVRSCAQVILWIFSGLIGHLHISLNARKKVSKTEARQKIDFGKSAGLPETEAARIVLTFLSHFK